MSGRWEVGEVVEMREEESRWRESRMKIQVKKGWNDENERLKKQIEGKEKAGIQPEKTQEER